MSAAFLGRRVAVRPPLDAELPAVARLLCDDRVLDRLGLEDAPSLDELRRHRIALTARADVAHGTVRVVMPLACADISGEPLGITVDYGYDYATDRVREIDVAFPEGRQEPAAYFDAILTLVLGLFRSQNARKVLWRVDAAAPGQGFRATFAHLGAVAMMDEVMVVPRTGERVAKRLYAVNREAYEKRLAVMV